MKITTKLSLMLLLSVVAFSFHAKPADASAGRSLEQIVEEMESNLGIIGSRKKKDNKRIARDALFLNIIELGTMTNNYGLQEEASDIECGENPWIIVRIAKQLVQKHSG